MSRAWVPSITVALVGPHASMPDDARLSDRAFRVCDLSTLRICEQQLASAAQQHSTAQRSPAAKDNVVASGGCRRTPQQHQQP
eukprot:1671232-Prymnesium_polylepis.1